MERRPNVEGIGPGHVLKAFGFIDEIQRDLPFDLGIHVAECSSDRTELAALHQSRFELMH